MANAICFEQKQSRWKRCWKWIPQYPHCCRAHHCNQGSESEEGKIVVMMIMHYNQYHDYFGSQSKKLTSAAAALPWMVCSEPRLGSSPQWSTTEETWHEVDEDFDQDDHDDWGFWSFWPFRFGLFAFNSLHISLHKPNIRNGFPSFEWNESSFIRPWVKKLSQYTANAHQPRQ